jgi:hypothetical protein
MAKRVYEEKNIADVAAKIRELIGNDTQYTSYDLANGVAEVFKAGYQAHIENIEEIVAVALEKAKEVVNITSIDEPYETFEDLPETAPDSTILLVNEEKTLYSFDANTGTWKKETTLKPHVAYVVLSGEKSGIYRYTMAEPYLISAEENAFGKAKKYVDERLAAIVGSAPETLNALNELAAALGNDPNFATTIANQIGTKASQKELQETESTILKGLGAILAAQEEILGGSV